MPRTPLGAPPCASFLPRSGSRGTTQPCPKTQASSPEQPTTTTSNSRVDDANSCSIPSAPSRADLAAGTMGSRMTCSPQIHLLSRGPDAAMAMPALGPLRPALSPTSSRTQQRYNVDAEEMNHDVSMLAWFKLLFGSVPPPKYVSTHDGSSSKKKKCSDASPKPGDDGYSSSDEFMSAPKKSKSKKLVCENSDDDFM